MIRIGMAPGGSPIPFSFGPLLHIMQQGLSMDCTSDQRQTAHRTKGVGMIHIPQSKLMDNVSCYLGYFEPQVC